MFSDRPFQALNDSIKIPLTTASTWQALNVKGCNSIQLYNSSTAVNGVATVMFTSASVTSPTSAAAAPGIHIPPGGTRNVMHNGGASTAAYLTACLSSGTGYLWVTPGQGGI